LLLVSGCVFCVIVRSRLVSEFDRALEAKGQALAMLMSREDRTIEIDFNADFMPEFDAAEDEDQDDAEEDDEGSLEYCQVFLEGGTVVWRSPSLGEEELPLAPERSPSTVVSGLMLPDGEDGRCVQIVFAPQVDEVDEEDEEEEAPDPNEVLYELPAGVDEESVRLVLVVARGRDDLDDVLGSLYLSVGVLTLVLLMGIGALVHLSITRGFRPIHAINGQIRGIGPDTLDGRVLINAPPEELATIVAALNGLLERVESGFARERRFSSDVAHELRTPVAELRTACEVGAKWPDDPEHVREFFADIQEVARQMERVVNNLLELTRCDNGTATVFEEPIVLAPFLDECWRRASHVAAANELTFDNNVPADLAVNADRGKLQMILQNIIDNAAAYSVPGTMVSAAAESQPGGGVVLVIGNRAASLEEEDVAHVFDRFWRKERSRTGGKHSGLGLSLVRDLAGVLGVELGVRLKEKDLFEVRVCFPAVD